MLTPTRQHLHAQIPTGGADVACAQQRFQEIPSVSRHSRLYFGSPPMTRDGEDHGPPVGPGTRWNHRGAIQDALSGTLRNRPGRGQWTSNSLTPTFSAIGPVLWTRTTKPTASTFRCASMPHIVSFLGTTGNVVLAPGYSCVPREEWLVRYRDTVLPKGTHVWCKRDDGLWWLAKSARVRRRL